MQADDPLKASREPPHRILLACPQRIGDVLLATPLARSMKCAWPDAAVDMLVFEGTEGVLEGNSDISGVIAVPRDAGLAGKFQQLRQLWRRYDLSVSPLPTDRARLYCWVAGRRRFGVIANNAKDRGKALLLDRHVMFDDLDTHTVNMGLLLTGPLGISPCFEVVAPRVPLLQLETLLGRLAPLAGDSYAVLHPFPKFRYKMWTTDAWIALANRLKLHGLKVIFSGSADPAEMAYVEEIARALPDTSLNLAGQLSLAETAELIRRARLYIGADTAVTHIAAATGVPTIALFGPSNPVKWGPWPSDWTGNASPWARRGSRRQGNVYLVQGEGDCVPCMLEGCDRHINSLSDCLQNMSVNNVMGAVATMLADAQVKAMRPTMRP